MANVILDRVVKAIPQQFFKALIVRQQPIYKQSIGTAFGESWGRAEAINVLPHIKRAYWESEFRKAAKECGLKIFDVSHAGDNCTYVMVKVDGLIITSHYVDGPRQFVRQFIFQLPDLFFELSFCLLWHWTSCCLARRKRSPR